MEGYCIILYITNTILNYFVYIILINYIINYIYKKLINYVVK